MSQKLSKSSKKVQNALDKHNMELKVVELPASTRTAQQAAAAIGCQVAQIVKSLVFVGRQSQKPLLLLVSGKNMVAEGVFEQLVGEPVAKADAKFVKQRTGFAIGGVPPLGHKEELVTFIDKDLLAHEYVWAAAGTPHAVFQLAGQELERLTNGRVIAVAFED